MISTRISDDVATLAAIGVAALLAAASILGFATVAGRALRRMAERRRVRLAAPARRLLLALAAGAAPDAASALADVSDRVWRAVEPSAAALLGKVRGESRTALVSVFVARGVHTRAERELGSRSAVRRARAAEVLGNLGRGEAVPVLCRALTDADPTVRLVATRALGRIADPQAVRPILRAAAGRRRRVPLSQAAHAVVRVGAPAVPAVAEFLDHPDPEVRRTALEILGLLAAVRVTDRVIRALRTDLSVDVRAQAALTLGLLGTRASLDPLLDAAGGDGPERLRSAAARALGSLGAPAAAGCLGTLLGDPHYAVAHHAGQALLRLGDAGRRELHAALPANPDPTGASAAAAHAREALALAALTTGPAAVSDLATVG